VDLSPLPTELLFCRDDRGSDSVFRGFKFPPQNHSLSRTMIELNVVVSVQDQHLRHRPSGLVREFPVPDGSCHRIPDHWQTCRMFSANLSRNECLGWSVSDKSVFSRIATRSSMVVLMVTTPSMNNKRTFSLQTR
jgi:hypothetical protein